MMNCRLCANTPFASLFGIESEEEPAKPAKKERAPAPPRHEEEEEEEELSAEKVLEPRSASELLILCRAWENYVHPRAKKMWESGGYLQKILENIARGTSKHDDPVLGEDSVCVEWHGAFSEDDRLPVITIFQPKRSDTDSIDDAHTFEESLSHVNRVLVFLYADDSSFSELETRTDTLVMACGNPSCVNLTHISLDD